MMKSIPDTTRTRPWPCSRGASYPERKKKIIISLNFYYELLFLQFGWKNKKLCHVMILLKSELVISNQLFLTMNDKKVSLNYLDETPYFFRISHLQDDSSEVIVISVLYSKYTHLYSYVCFTYCMHGLCTCILHNSETLEPLTWIRVRPSHHYAHSLSLSLSLSHSFSRTHVLYHVHLNISKYTTFKPITRLVLSYINLATYLTLR